MDDKALRRALLDLGYERLNPQQRQAVFQIEGPLLVLAGAGSGKTSVLTNRIAYMLNYGNAYHADTAPSYTDEQRAHLQACLKDGELDDEARALLREEPVSPYNILAITFTNKAAGEMRERITAAAGELGEQVWVSTFHAACARILRRDIEKLGYANNFTILDDDDQTSVIKQVLKEMNLSDKDYVPREIRARISHAKMLMQTPDEMFMESNRDYKSQQLSDIYRKYEEHLKKNNSLDFDDLLLKTLELFVNHPPVLEYYAHRFRYVLVDEYQDTNHVQYMFVHLIARKWQNLCVVGDDDQSIYGWRGADISNILDFEKDYKNCQVIKLEQNYRSTGNILDAANAVISHNLGRKQKQLWSERGEGMPVIEVALNDERDEASMVSREILSLRASGTPYHEIAVLYRTNAQSRVLEEQMVFSGIPYEVYGGHRFYERKEVKDMVCYLRICVNPNDEIALRRVINEPKRGIGDATVEALSRWAAQNGDTLFGAVLDVDETGALNARAASMVRQFGSVMSELLALKELLPPAEFVRQMADKTGMLRQYDKDDEESQSRLQNIRELIGAVEEYERSVDEPTIEGFLEEAALVSDIDGLNESSGKVTMMTIHSAKGLEFETVFVTGMEDGIFPGARAVMEENRMEEERRLCYVAITRAKDRLYLSYAQHRMLYGSPQYNRPSKFLSEIPDDLVNRIDRTLSADTRKFSRPAARQVFSGEPAVVVPRPSAPKTPEGDYKAGDVIVHRKFGQGRIVQVKGNVVHVAFPGQGIKELDVRFAPIKKGE